jgi:antitoxin component YwqK of YwqJK toxin-antitoxin module
LEVEGSELEELGLEVPAFTGPRSETLSPENPRWFRSNAAGMMLEEVFSRLAALRNEYALLVDFFLPEELPEMLTPYYNSPYRIEVHILYKNGEESRRQWIFRDAGGTARLTAVFNQEPPDTPPGETEPGIPETENAEDGDAPEDGGEEAEDGDVPEEAAETAEADGPTPTGRTPVGFIEMYNEDGWLTTEHLFQEGGEEETTDFFYRNQRLIRAETGRKTRNEEGEKITPMYTDFYRYSRSASLRAVERLYHEGAADAGSPVRLTFPHMILDAAADKDFVSPGLSGRPDFLEDVWVGDGYRILYTTNERGQILTESRQDDTGAVVWELKNNWSEDRLVSVAVKTGDDERLIEYGYDGEGNRITERNYHNGVLERVVRADGTQEIEELYMNGDVILRAVWEDGRKISEKRIRPNQ